MGDFIRVVGARENNLKSVDLCIPKKRITVFTGVSGSGKSSLVFDTIAAESQRQLNETFSSFIRHRLPHHGQPEADSLQNLSAAIVVDQKRLGGTARSTVGTVTDIHSLLRLLYSRIGAPFVGYSDVFSFNNPAGMCPECEGLGTVSTIDLDALIDRTKSLNEGAIRFPSFEVGGWRWTRYVRSGFFDNDKKLADYTEDEWRTLLYEDDKPVVNPLPGWPPSSKYEGVVPRFQRSFLTKKSKEVEGRHKEAFERVVTRGPCPKCKGRRLNSKVLGCKIEGRNIADCAALEVRELAGVMRAIDARAAPPVRDAIVERLEQLTAIGLGYLSLDRETSTLSGGESQRVKMVRHLGSSLTDLTYVFDEPSTGLHPRDVHQLNELMKVLRDKGNTVLIVEHDPDVLAIADHVVDMGPGAGREGGEVVYQGDRAGLIRSKTRTGKYLRRRSELKAKTRSARGWLAVRRASLHNLRDVSVEIPKGVLTVVTGVAGSGKSSLIHGVLRKTYPETVSIDQSPLRGSKRSNPATYIGILDAIRESFARANGVSASLFSSNSSGACPECRGLGTTYMDLAFMDPIVSRCEACQGRRFTERVLRYTVRGKNIHEVLASTVADALEFFVEDGIQSALQRLADVGLGYLTLGQSLDTLSGGERQRLKLATELENAGPIYVFDEPTTGLHMSDVDRLVKLLDRLVEQGSTVIVIEHNLDVIRRADWIIDMGPGAGHDGGRVIFEGTPAELVADRDSATGRHLKMYLSATPFDGARQLHP
ncbi:ATP-binding cassette domain-containing protein [Pendulispora albinea]|uniref:UvrABC system protein A n=1 Tax=Pendulispora albinea TaxID=2741071 RepID=A0ABZ2M406_9BACT